MGDFFAAPGTMFLGHAGWFYGIFASIFIIILALILFALLKRNRDEWWQTKGGF